MEVMEEVDGGYRGGNAGIGLSGLRNRIELNSFRVACFDYCNELRISIAHAIL